MNQERYQRTQVAICRLSEIIRQLPIEEFIEAINTADTLGPILDPTLYREGGEKMMEIKRLAEPMVVITRQRNRMREKSSDQVNQINGASASALISILTA